MERLEQILILINKFKKHPKWNSFYLKSTQELIQTLSIPEHEIITCTLNEMNLNEDFCLPLFISKDQHFYPSIKECFKHSIQNQTVAVLIFDQNHFLNNLSICYLHQNELTTIEKIEL